MLTGRISPDLPFDCFSKVKALYCRRSRKSRKSQRAKERIGFICNLNLSSLPHYTPHLTSPHLTSRSARDISCTIVELTHMLNGHLAYVFKY